MSNAPTAMPVVPGYLTTSGCPAGETSCFVQNGPVSAKGDQRTFTLASNITLAPGQSTPPILIDISAQYGWVYQFGGTAGTTILTLKFLGPDGSTYLTSTYTFTATGATNSGSQFVPITAGASGAYVEVSNTGSTSATSLYTTLAS